MTRGERDTKLPSHPENQPGNVLRNANRRGRRYNRWLGMLCVIPRSFPFRFLQQYDNIYFSEAEGLGMHAITCCVCHHR